MSHMLCLIHHKNKKKHGLWLEYQICMVCFYLFGIFSLNNNHLKENYDGEEMIRQIIDDEYKDQNFIDAIYHKYWRFG